MSPRALAAEAARRILAEIAADGLTEATLADAAAAVSRPSKRRPGGAS